MWMVHIILLILDVFMNYHGLIISHSWCFGVSLAIWFSKKNHAGLPDLLPCFLGIFGWRVVQLEMTITIGNLVIFHNRYLEIGLELKYPLPTWIVWDNCDASMTLRFVWFTFERRHLEHWTLLTVATLY